MHLLEFKEFEEAHAFSIEGMCEEYRAASKTLKASPHFRNWLVKPQNFKSPLLEAL